jgi:hypothetical protein
METLHQSNKWSKKPIGVTRLIPSDLPDHGLNLATPAFMMLIQSPSSTLGERWRMPQAETELPTTEVTRGRYRVRKLQVPRCQILKVPELGFSLFRYGSHGCAVLCRTHRMRRR